MKIQNKNFLYNVLYQVFVFIIPLVTTPYISRVLGVNNVGVYSFTYSIVYYFMLASMLGISNYGAREISKCKNKTDTTKKFKSIYLLQLLLNVFFVISYCIFVYLINYEYKNIMFIQLIFLISVAFDINWFYFGKEEFKITISRNIIIKLVSLIFIFVFVKSSSDLWIYTMITSLSTLVSQLYLWIFIRKYIDDTKVSFSNVIAHLKPCLILFIPVISYSIYRVMDKTMIGYMSSTIELGNYESAEKIINIPISFITALGTVMMPHMAKKNAQEIKKSIYDTFELTFFVIAPMLVGLILIASDFSVVFFGNEYDKTGTIIRILTSTILFASVANVIRTSFLIPLKHDKIYVTSTILGALVNLSCNLIFIKMYGAYGACIGTVAAEFTLMAYQAFKTRDNINYMKVIKIMFVYFMKALFMGIIIYLIGKLIGNIYFRLFVQILVAVIVYCMLNYKYIKEDFFGKR